MAVRDLVIHPNPILRKKAETVVDFDKQLHQLLDDLAESMYFHNGVGLAAPQIAVSQRVTVIDVERKDDKPKLIELVNPTIVELSDQIVEGDEGCLSFPGESEQVNRPQQVRVKAFDRHGKSFEIETQGLLSRALQHEIDHLDGVLFIDKLSRIKRGLIDRRMKKLAKKNPA